MSPQPRKGSAAASRRKPSKGSRKAPSRGQRSRSTKKAPADLKDRLEELQRWHRWHPSGPQSTGLARMQQWVSAYSEGVLEPGKPEKDRATGYIAA